MCAGSLAADVQVFNKGLSQTLPAQLLPVSKDVKAVTFRPVTLNLPGQVSLCLEPHIPTGLIQPVTAPTEDAYNGTSILFNVVWCS